MGRSPYQPRSLAELLAMTAGEVRSYPARFVRQLQAIDDRLPEGLATIDQLDTGHATAALRCALEYACQAQNVLNTELGRSAVVAMSREWVRSSIVLIARDTLDLRDEWELRRLLELLDVVDQRLQGHLAAEVLESGPESLRDAAADYLLESEIETKLLVEAIDHVRGLFTSATCRLAERGIGLQVEAGVVGWIIAERRWPTPPNSIKNLDQVWQQQFGATVEALMHVDSLRTGDVLRVRPANRKGELSFAIDRKS